MVWKGEVIQERCSSRVQEEILQVDRTAEEGERGRVRRFGVPHIWTDHVDFEGIESERNPEAASKNFWMFDQQSRTKSIVLNC